MTCQECPHVSSNGRHSATAQNLVIDNRRRYVYNSPPDVQHSAVPSVAVLDGEMMWGIWISAYALGSMPLDTGWMGCPGDVHGATASTAGFAPRDNGCIDAVVPGTILHSMLVNGSYFPQLSPDDVYFDENLRRIPDISVAGKAFYTWTYRKELAPLLLKLNLDRDRRSAAYAAAASVNSDRGGASARSDRADVVDGSDGGRVWLRLRGVSYFATVYVNGVAVSPAESPNTHRLQGMFHRWSFDLGKLSEIAGLAKSEGGFAVAVRVEPPEYPGAGCTKCADPPCTPCGQGGDHQIARNPAMMQFMQGWDWCQATPDRNTGLWDAVTLELTSNIVISDPYVRTLTIATAPPSSTSAHLGPPTAATIEAVAGLMNRGRETVSGILQFNLINTHDITVATATLPLTLQPNSTTEATVGQVHVANVTLWWPHTHGTGPYLYTANFTFSVTGEPDAAAAETAIKVGIRTVDAVVDPQLGGRLFKINGEKIYIEGGNWIATDQLQRYATDRQRYHNEVMMHAAMGLNLIRVWGGGLTERPEFYDAADELGVLVMQEFWMSGDNNGRWAGSFDWPENHNVYLDNAADMVKMLRCHPSLLFWCGGNELYPVVQQPVNHTHADPGDPAVQLELLRQLEAVVHALDPGRFFIASSMSNVTDFDPAFALAPTDGNYGINPPALYFERNPGLAFKGNGSHMDSVKVPFQPEIGSVSSPVVESLRRFMSLDALTAFPRPVAPGQPPPSLHPVWEYHNYEGFTTADPVVDYLARFGVPTTIEEYAMQAQMAQFFQYQALFEGFQHHAFTFTSAVIFWKSQSPWPALRGAFYDHYLDTTGGFWGVRAACGEDVHAQLNQADRTLAVVSRRFAAVAGATMTASWYSMETGAQLGEVHSVVSILVHPNSVTRVGGTDAVPWPAEAKDTDVLMLRLGLTEPDGTTLSTNEYWLARGGDGTAVSVTAWGRFRHFHAESPPATLVVLATSTHPDAKNAIGITVTIRLAQSAAVGLMVRAQIATSDTALKRESDGVETDTRVLPVWWSHNYVSILPGEERVLTAECTAASPVAAPLYLRVDGYNVRPLVIRISSPTQA